jgi:hypothetical protein
MRPYTAREWSALATIAVLVLAIANVTGTGCGKGAPTEEERPREESRANPPHPASKESDAPTDGKPVPAVVEVAFDDLIKQYKDNPIAADQKYLNKRVAVRTVAETIKKKEGAVTVGQRFSDNAASEPTLYFHFPSTKRAEDAVAKLTRGARVTITGTCKGRTDDGVFRTFAGYEFHITMNECYVSDFGDWSKKK